MAKNSREGNQSRNKRYREALAERGIRPVQVFAPESAHPLIRQAAGLMIRDDNPLEPRAALRQVGGANELEPDDPSAKLLAELDEARSRIAAIELDAQKQGAEIEAAERQIKTLEAERDAAKESKAKIISEAKQVIQEARNRAKAALGRATQAEGTIDQVKALPGIRGLLVRWLAGDILPD
jgi:hypothetical protein